MSEDSTLDRFGKSPAGRKLIAVVYADMVGYSRLIGLDDIGTLERLRTLRRNLIDPAIDEYGGRIVQTGGDSLLMVFDSIDGAVRCAMKVQQDVPIHDSEQSADRVIRFRVGINIGDAIADGTDLHGDAVNVAARLQAECPPGEICVSRAVRDHVHGYLDLTFEELGTLNLKNIERPIEAFLLKLGAAATRANTVERPPVHSKSESLSLPETPSIAVMAFTNMSADPEQEYFSDGIADDIITELSRSHWLLVIARNSSFTYKGRVVQVKQIAGELGVRYVLQGSVRRVGRQVRVNAQLIDAETGNHLWADRYDCILADIFAVQDEIVDAVANAIRPAVGDAEQRRVLRKQPDNLSAWETYQRGLWHQSIGTPAENEQARVLFQQAAEIDPGFASAFSGLALTLLKDALSYGVRGISEAARLAEVAARKAVGIDPNDSEAHSTLAAVFTCTDDLHTAEVCVDRALALNRSSASAHWQKSVILTYSGRCVEGRNEALKSLRLNPRDPASAMAASMIPASYYLEQDYAMTVETARRCVADYPNYAMPRRYLAAALGQLGRQEEAAAALREFLSLAPSIFEVTVRNRLPFVRPEDHEHLLEGLRKAGMQE
jgi:adenylate cyclase